MNRIARLGVGALLVAATPLFAQTPKPITVAWCYSDDAEALTSMPKTFWTSDGDLLLLDESRPVASRTLERVRAATGERRPAIDQAAAAASLKTALAGNSAPDALPWPNSFDRKGRLAVYVVDGDLFLLDLAAARFDRLTHTPEAESIARLSPDGKKVAFVRGNDLWVYDLASKKETRITSDGSDTVLNGSLSWVYWEEVFNHHEEGYWWSDDSKAIAFLRTDEAGVDEVGFQKYSPAVPEVVKQRYPKAGDKNPVVRLGVADLATGKTAWMNSTSPAYEYVLGVTWLPDSRAVAVQTTDRPQTRLDLWRVDRESGRATLVLTDRDEAWVDQKELQYVGNGDFVVSSERDGHTHLYRYDADGRLLNSVTRGPWSVRGPEGFYGAPLESTWIDPKSEWVFFTARQKPEGELQLYRTRLNGTGMQRITREDGTHRITMGPDRRFYLDEYSSTNVPPSLSLHSIDGTRIAVLYGPRNDLIAPFDFQKAEIFTVPARDGFALPVRILKPRDFDPATRYPAIVYIYGGPGAPTVNDAWDYSFAANTLYDQVLANRGYVVFSVDPRSATGQSKTLENLVLRHMQTDEVLNDVVDGVKWLKTQPFVDPDRVGVWGWSGGGTDTLLCMTRSQEFKAGISIAPVTDWHFYDTKFTETYMKTPADNPDGYALFNLSTRAKDLHGRLLLVFGSGDDNVHPQNEWSFIQELVAADKPFDLMVYPMRKHTIADVPARIHLFEKMLEFWKLYL
jgi:dipeptidyl-peptidase-4